MPPEMAAPATVYLGIGLFMLCQLMVLGMLFRREVIAEFRVRS